MPCLRGSSGGADAGPAGRHPVVLPDRLSHLLCQRADRRLGSVAMPREERRQPVVVMPASRAGRERRRNQHDCASASHRSGDDGRAGFKLSPCGYRTCCVRAGGSTRRRRSPATRGGGADAASMRARLSQLLRRCPHHRRRRDELPHVACRLALAIMQECIGQAGTEILARRAEPCALQEGHPKFRFCLRRVMPDARSQSHLPRGL